MAFSEGYGIGSLKPGVCTSTTRPASPYNGQMIYETDTDKVAVYDSSAWVYKTGSTVPGLVYITQATPTAVNTVSINNCFTSTYANYLIVVDISAIVSVGSLDARFRLNGTDTTTNYVSQRLGGQTTTPFASANPTGTDDIYIGALDPAFPATFNSTINVFSPALARQTNLHNYNVSNETNGTLIQLTYGNQTTTTAYDGITFKTTGTSFTGTIRVYGYQNS